MGSLAGTAAGRPYPIPRQPWIMAMQWHDLLFMHWPLDPAVVQPFIPRGLELDLFEGQAWIAVVPFYMRGVGPRFVTGLPWVSTFAELNVRTYVTAEGKPGVWFFSLDAANAFAVQTARMGFYLPYFNARMQVKQKQDWIYYKSIRTHRGAPPATFGARYRPTGAVYNSEPGTLEYWLTERYCLYSANSHSDVFRGDIDHARWPLQPAEAQVAYNTMTEQAGIELPNRQPLLHFARRLDVRAWVVRRVRSGE
ncbi:MAG: DUF2071 domain-containing protein [Chloroflexota bacterium]